MRRSRGSIRLVIAGALAAALPASTQAQGALVPSGEWRASPVFSTWHFGKALTQAAGDVTDVSQVAVPLRARFHPRQRWTVDVSGAVSSSNVSLSSNGDKRSLSLTGLSDLSVRLTGPIKGEALLLTAGLNIPTGSTSLDADGTTVLQTVAAPALGMPVGALGLGFGGTVGVLGAREFGAWALALGASIEQRAEYTPVALVLAGGTSRTTLAPGTAGHLSLGADRSIGEQRLSLLFVADAYAEDELTMETGTAASASKYSLGPQVSAIARLEFAAPGWHDAAANASFRLRSEYSDATGSTVAGSGGSYMEASLGGVRGAPTYPGLILGADARYHSGLEFTSALVGAAVTSVGATVGVEWPFARAALRVALRAQAGSLNTGSSSTSIMGLQLSGSLSARGGSR